MTFCPICHASRKSECRVLSRCATRHRSRLLTVSPTSCCLCIDCQLCLLDCFVQLGGNRLRCDTVGWQRCRAKVLPALCCRLCGGACCCHQRDQQRIMRQGQGLPVLAVLLCAVRAVRQPVRRPEVDGLSTIETCVETRMESIRIRDHKRVLMVHQPIHWHPSSLKLPGGYHRDQLVQQVGSGVHQMRDSVSDGLLQRLTGMRWNTIPHLGSTKMMVVDAVQGMILHVPAERRQHTPHVEPRHLYAGDELIASQVAKGRSTMSRQVIDVPGMRGVVRLRLLRPHLISSTCIRSKAICRLFGSSGRGRGCS
mmetsp:Transcript_17956/g.54031  ORF Transcript_17956/g.54031 Transcript_17956/m.54031 type:complete len:310 (+) Transcript_17956:2392-3321(+)